MKTWTNSEITVTNELIHNETGEVAMENNLFLKILHDAYNEKTAVAAINILNHGTTRAVVSAAERAQCAVILQPSVITVKRYGVDNIKRMVDSVRWKSTVPVSLHLDHCKDEELTKNCVLAGWDSVMVDFSALPFDENISRTHGIVEFAHEHGVTVEGEIGIIAGVEDDMASDKSCLASLEETLEFIEKTGVDAIAPAIGTAHGVYKGRPILNYELVSDLREKGALVVVHGGTGLTDEEFTELIDRGAVKVNISTALKQVYLNTSKDFLMGEKIAPVEFDNLVETACSEEMEKFIRLFGRKK